MKISELKRIAKENDYELKEKKETKEITLERKVTYDGLISNVITISLIIKNLIFIENEYCDDKDVKMIKAAVEFAETPIDDREEEKKFYLKHRYFKHWDDVQYLTFDYIHNCAYLGCKLSICQAMQQFTLKEIEEIKKKFNIDLKDFEMIEVEE